MEALLRQPKVRVDDGVHCVGSCKKGEALTWVERDDLDEMPAFYATDIVDWSERVAATKPRDPTRGGVGHLIRDATIDWIKEGLVATYLAESRALANCEESDGMIVATRDLKDEELYLSYGVKYWMDKAEPLLLARANLARVDLRRRDLFDEVVHRLDTFEQESDWTQSHSIKEYDGYGVWFWISAKPKVRAAYAARFGFTIPSLPMKEYIESLYDHFGLEHNKKMRLAHAQGLKFGKDIPW